MLRFVLVYAVLVSNSGLKEKSRIQLPDFIYEVKAICVKDNDLYVVDKKECAVAKVSSKGNLLARVQGKGQGPGEFQMPRSIAVSSDLVYVGDIFKILIFDKNLKFISEYPIGTNPSTLKIWNNAIYSTSVIHPAKVLSISKLNMKVEFLKQFYPHEADTKLYDGTHLNPYFEFNTVGTLFILNRLKYQVDMYTENGEKIAQFPTLPSPGYHPFTSVAPFDKKYGYTLVGLQKWLSNWSEPCGIGIVKDRFMFVCFSELSKDFLNTRYFIDVYDIKTQKKVILWQETNGRLMCGGEYAYFLEHFDNENELDYISAIVSYEVN